MRGGLGNIMKQAQKMQEEMQKAQAEMVDLEVVGEAGGGMVKVTMNGKHEARGVSIDPTLMDDQDMLEDLVAAAINDAARKVESSVSDRMGDITSGMPLPPGMKFPF